MFSSSILLAAALAVAAPPQTGDTARVPKLGADGKPPLRYEQIIETTAKSGLKGRAQRTLMKQVNRVAVVALKPLPSGERRAQVIYESVRVTGNGAPPALKQVYSRFGGASLTATLNARGEITKLDGYEALIKRLSGGNAELAQRLRQAFREDALKQMFAGWFSRMPPGDIEKGTQWKNKGTFAAGPVGEIAGELTTTYQGRLRHGGRECGRFKLEAESTYALPSGSGILGYEIVKGELKITGPRGEQLFDVRAGHIIKSDHSTRIVGRVTVKAGGRQATLSIDNKETVQVRLLSGLGTATKVTEEPVATKKQPVLRKWTSSSGNFSIEARLVEAKDGIAQLKRQDGKIIAVPVSKLSKADRKYLASIAKAKNKPVAPDKGEKKEKSDAEKIQGKWTLVEYLHKGEKSGEAGTVVTFSGNKMTSTPAGRSDLKVEGTIKLRPNKKPPEMDMVMKLGGRTFTTGAIYELSGDTLKICSRGPGEPRPKKIGSTSVNGQQLMVLKRAKGGGKK